MFERSPKPNVSPPVWAHAPQRAAAPPATEPLPRLASVPLDLARTAFGPAGQSAREDSRRELPAFRLNVAPRDAPVQRRKGPVPARRHSLDPEAVAARQAAGAPTRPDHGGPPPKPRAGAEAPPGLPMNEVRVCYRSPSPARPGAPALAKGRDLPLGRGQEEHLPHEAQPAQYHINPTLQMRGVAIHDDARLKTEAYASGRVLERHVGDAQVIDDRSDAPRPGRTSASQVVQRKIKMDGRKFHIPKNAPGKIDDKREFWGNLQRALAQLGFKATGTKGFNKHVQEMLQEGKHSFESFEGENGEEFNPYHSLIQDALKKGKLSTPAPFGYQFGPKTLGARPTFQGSAAKLKIKPGEHRRHIISSSTLGKAIEDSKAKSNDVQGFLERNRESFKASGLSAPGKKPKLPRRTIWELAHNHTGNLWVGDGGQNTAAGFIRGQIMRKRKDFLKNLKSGEKITKEHIQRLLPNKAESKSDTHHEVWNSARSTLQTAYEQKFVEKEKVGKGITREDIEGVSDEWIANTDLDLPSTQLKKGYYEELRGIYGGIKSEDKHRNLLSKGGALERFLNLSHIPDDPSAQTGAKTEGEGKQKVPAISSKPVVKLITGRTIESGSQKEGAHRSAETRDAAASGVGEIKSVPAETATLKTSKQSGSSSSVASTTKPDVAREKEPEPRGGTMDAAEETERDVEDDEDDYENYYEDDDFVPEREPDYDELTRQGQKDRDEENTHETSLYTEIKSVTNQRTKEAVKFLGRDTIGDGKKLKLLESDKKRSPRKLKIKAQRKINEQMKGENKSDSEDKSESDS